jgi:hypothetical protein
MLLSKQKKISAYWVKCYVATATRTCTCEMQNWCAERRHFHFFCMVLSVHFKTRYLRLQLEFWHEIKNIAFGVKSREESWNKWKPILKWRWNNCVIVTGTKWFMITRALLAQIRLFGFSLRFNYLELRSEGLRQTEDIEACYIEGCNFRNNITVSLVRQPYEALSLDNFGLFISIIKQSSVELFKFAANTFSCLSYR